MKFFKEIKEAESWASTIVGYKFFKYYGLDDKKPTNVGLRVGVYLGFMLIKMDFILNRNDKKDRQDNL